MKAYNKTLLQRLPILVGLLIFSIDGFSQVQKMTVEDFQASGSILQADKEQFNQFVDGSFSSLEITENENYKVGDGEVKVIALASKSSLYEKLSSLENKTEIEVIQINFKKGSSLPDKAIFQSFPNLKFLLVQGLNISVSDVSEPNLGADRELYLLIRNISAD
ncbi:hypothetical protein [uncultured Algoriphagus sp.]|jgi:hypothetical protein|uniref:hypothetical protein n=2 Tax=Algoriphagus TaxID=246875 RepID=UPI001065A8D8|nr:hypothetical protein [uncultured Algoriphagus sp.]